MYIFVPDPLDQLIGLSHGSSHQAMAFVIHIALFKIITEAVVILRDWIVGPDIP